MSSIDDNMIFELDDAQKDIVQKNLGEDGKLSCLKAFKVARLIGVKPIEISAITKSLGVKITDCELGVFGNLDFHEPDLQLYKEIKAKYPTDEIKCEALWNEAKGSTLKAVGSTAKHTDIEVVDCQLGCFRKKKGRRESKSKNLD